MPLYVPPPSVTLLNGIDVNQTIYRVFDRIHFEQLITQKQMALVRPELWNDPFENLVHQGSVYVNGQSYGLDPLRRSYFAQCWTLKAESDAIWRIYSEDGRGIRIKTTVQKLGDVLLGKAVSLNQEVHAFHKCFVGKVQYSNMEEIIALMQNSSVRATILKIQPVSVALRRSCTSGKLSTMSKKSGLSTIMLAILKGTFNLTLCSSTCPKILWRKFAFIHG